MRVIYVVFAVFLMALMATPGSGRGSELSLDPSLLQGEQDRQERWVHVNLIKFNKASCKVLHFRLGNPRHKERLGGEWDFSWGERFGGAGGGDLDMTEP
ncbi:hypothetical protein DUI87_05642 [Hirundo rustica rustica]|uniref:Uncharacterized protein n=1 Tax=Hirundo rustica rustica TaxID=333673 RepID=A0A3M0LD69_HIRRU|nr:hypothetical protein DUI87_05642 [Hirundo rustica rustica]